MNASHPLIRPDVLEGLQRELGISQTFAQFLRHFVATWPSRYRVLVHALRIGDKDRAMDVILTMRASSKVLGADRLARLVMELEWMVRAGRINAAKTLLDAVGSTGESTLQQLNSELAAMTDGS